MDKCVFIASLVVPDWGFSRSFLKRLHRVHRCFSMMQPLLDERRTSDVASECINLIVVEVKTRVCPVQDIEQNPIMSPDPYRLAKTGLLSDKSCSLYTMAEGHILEPLTPVRHQELLVATV